MTEEEINAAVAELCGWELVDCKRTGRNPARSFDHYDKHGNEPIPNYCAEMNEMHDVLVTLPLELRNEFVAQLARVIDPGCPDPSTFHPFTWITVTARQLAEAFLRVHESRGKHEP